MFEFLPMPLPGAWEVIPVVRGDERGRFVKTFHFDAFNQRGLATGFREQYYSVSRRGVLRGMHFQTPPHDHAKLVTCLRGRVLDAALDLRRGSPTCGMHHLLELDAKKGNMAYLPPGLAHGFLALSETALVLYNVTSVYAPESDAGLRWDSVGIDWPLAEPVLSPRDKDLPHLDNFQSPFTYHSPTG